MPLPPRRKRSAFGGKEGVWFRRKKISLELVPSGAECDEENTVPGEPPVACKLDEVTTLFVNETALVEWDEALARPIYRRTVSENQVVSSSSDESGDDQENATPDLPHEEESVRKRARSEAPRNSLGVKRGKTFGGRSRRPLSLLLSQDNIPIDAASSSSTSESERLVSTIPALQVNDDPLDPPGSSEASSGTAETHQRTSRVSLSPDVSQGIDVGEDDLQSFSSSSTSPASEPKNPFEFTTEDEEQVPARPLGTNTTPRRPTATSSIEQAKRYFDHLDASCNLQLDSSSSPSPRRRIIRTIRKIHLSSPGFLDEYSKYVEATREMGISPLKTVDYAKSRRQFFRKSELFDGFVDS